MKPKKPANAKVRDLRKKLQALAEHGIDGEKISAQNKLARLEARFDFGAPDPSEMPDLFSGVFKHSASARRIYSFDAGELDVANSVKWAIESATKIPCLYRGGDLLAQAAPATARKLAEIAGQIAHSFGALLGKFGAMDGVTVSDRGVFVMGLYDGMMNEARDAGQRLPGPSQVAKKTRRRKAAVKPAVTPAPSLHIHPYTVAVSLGRQIRFSAPLEQIAAELDAVAQKYLAKHQT